MELMNIKVTPEISFSQIWKHIFLRFIVAFIKAIDKQGLTPCDEPAAKLHWICWEKNEDKR